MGTVRLRAIRTQLHISPCISSLSLLPSSWPLVPKLLFLPAFPLPMPVFLTLTPPVFTIPMLLPPLATPFPHPSPPTTFFLPQERSSRPPSSPKLSRRSSNMDILSVTKQKRPQRP